MPDNNNERRKQNWAAVLLLLGNIVYFLTLWLLQKYDKIYFDQVLYQMKTSSAGVHHALAGSAVMWVGGLGVGTTAVQMLIYRLFTGTLADRLNASRRRIACCAARACRFLRRRAVSLAAALLAVCVAFFAAELDVVAYAITISTESDFIEEHYADPQGVTLTFPEEKRNLIHIYLESMENTYADTAAGGFIDSNYISELEALARDNVSFSNTAGMGGALSFAGTTWTAAAMVSQTAGVPVKVPITADAYGDEELFMPGVVSIGEILEEAGYQQTFLAGSDAEFHGKEPYFVQHGGYTILDTNALKEAGRLDEDYREWWGFEDEKLFAFAKEELTRLASQDAPFNLTILTADTHFPDGYKCRLCRDEHEEQYANVLSCSSRQVDEFVSWIREQPFYQNTTIVISGDHLTMDAEFMEEIDGNYTRTVYNCIINAPISPVREKNRQFATFDMFPTTLAALGVTIEGDRLGLGTNLFSDQETLTEQYGFDTLDQVLQTKSEFYNAKILGMDSES